MKKITLFMALVCAVNIFAQQKVAQHVQQLTSVNTTFRAILPLAATNKPNTTPAANVATNATFATLNERVIQDIAANKYPFIELGIPYNGSVTNVLLYRVEVLARDFHVDTDKQTNVPHTNGVFYRGIVKGDSNSLASFSFFETEMSGIISAAGINNLVVGRLQRTGNLSDYIIYSDSQLTIPFTYTCGASDDEPLPDSQLRSPQETLSDKCVTIYFELDHDTYLDNGSDVGTASNWITAIFNNVQTLYENDGITTALRSIYVWTEEDPYGGNSSSDYLEEFFALRPSFDGDVGQFITTNGGGLGGVAGGIGSLCSGRNISFSDVFFDYQDVPTFSWTVQVITHELGHVFGSPHTHGCYWNGNNTSIDGCGTQAGYVEGNCTLGPIPTSGGTIMSYCHLVSGTGINFANGFGTQPRARILSHLSSSLCLSSDCVNVCLNTVTQFAVASTPTTATITWEDTIDGPWEISNTSVNGLPLFYRQVATNSATITNLTPNTYYKFAVRPYCGEGMRAESETFNFATSADWCSGALFLDAGGANANYGNNQRIVRTLKPEIPGQVFTVTFNTFSTEADYDTLNVYDGPNTNSPLIGAYSGEVIPGPFVSTAADRSLTFEFRSDGSTTGAGWSASVSCVLGVKENTFTNLQYFPNPTNGNVTITSAEGITGITVYNVAGQLLLNKAVNGTTAETDIAAFANGVYFFKVTNGNKTANFRIVKQ
jgi:hypothetical protein